MIYRTYSDLASDREAIFSDCEKYRYWLKITFRHVASRQHVNYLLLNPSTATELKNDPTISRCEVRARREGFGGLIITNLFAFRATNPKEMLAYKDPVGTDSDRYILQAAMTASQVVCGWGNHGRHLNRSQGVFEVFADNGIEVWELARCKSGEPSHPLYLGYDKKPVLRAEINEPSTHSR